MAEPVLDRTGVVAGVGERVAAAVAQHVGVQRKGEAWYNLGDWLGDQGRSEAAIQCLRKSLRAAPDYADAMFNLALLSQRRNECSEAADYWRRYLAIDGQSEWAIRARRSLKFCAMQQHLTA